MKITIYTITDCQFSKQEKEYLSSHGLAFEEKNLETNREYLTEMLAVGSNFAGTPVTKIEKDDGQITVLKGFTPAEFDKTLAIEPTPQPQTVPQELPAAEVIPPPQAAPTPVAAVPEAPAAQAAPSTDPAIASILDNLEQQSQPPQAVPAPQAAAPQPADSNPATAPVSGQPVIPDPQF